MAIGVVTDEQLQEELARTRIPSLIPRPTVEAEVIEKEKPGRKEGDVNVPNSLRKLLGEESNINGRASALELAESLGISPSSVSAYAHGATSTATYDTPKKSILDHIKASKERALEKAHNKLGIALDGITPDKLNDIKARDLAGIAKDMSAVIKNLEPEKQQDVDPNLPRFVVFAPQFVKEEKFETIIVNE